MECASVSQCTQSLSVLALQLLVVVLTVLIVQVKNWLPSVAATGFSLALDFLQSKRRSMTSYALPLSDVKKSASSQSSEQLETPASTTL